MKKVMRLRSPHAADPLSSHAALLTLRGEQSCRGIADTCGVRRRKVCDPAVCDRTW